MKSVSTKYLVLGGLPLVLYPFVALADMMSLAGHWSGDEPAVLVVIIKSFLWGSLAYPVVYLPCLLLSRRALKAGRETAAFRFSMAPIVYLVVLIALLVAWAGGS